MSLFRRTETPTKGPFRSRQVGRSWPGMLSVIVAILAFLLIVGELVFVQYFQANHTLLSFFTIFDPGLTCVTTLLALVGLGLGIATVVQKETRRIFGLLGLILNGLFLLTIGVLYAINLFALMRAVGT